ncbi:MAG: glycerol kinase GlpK [Gemmataceae bacterium]|nr:glycerol kinase GlpK [Gemmataceae bacterium]
MTYLLTIDQGTTSTRALVIDCAGRCLGTAQMEFRQHFPQPGWVEHDAVEIWETVRTVVPAALAQAKVAPPQIAAIGITNQRETVVLWERSTGRPAAKAIVWQDRRTADFCQQRRADEAWLRQKTGLVLDPYFSATKIRWRLDSDTALRRRAEAGDLACGTIDSWLIWNLTGGTEHATDVSNASRTLLLDIHRTAWDDDLCRYFDVPRHLLPKVRASAADYGLTSDVGFLPAGIPIRGVAGDQQAALFGQGCFRAGEAKCTYGTGAFLLAHTGPQAITSHNRLLTSLAATIDDTPQYVLEGSVFVAGAAVQWLRDGLRLVSAAADVESLAQRADADQRIIFVPALVGLGAPYWSASARGTIFGLTRNTTAAELARAVLDGVALQVVDLIEAADRDAGSPLAMLRVDGGMARNAWFLQRQADLLGRPVQAAGHAEATAYGAAFLAGLQIGMWPDVEALKRLLRPGTEYLPRWSDADRRRHLAVWRRAVDAVVAFYSGWDLNG